MIEFDYTDLGGGVNLGAARNALPSREMARLVNWYPTHGKLVRRGGTKLRVTGSSATDSWTSLDDREITSLFPMKRKDGTFLLLVGGRTRFGKFSNNAITLLSGPTHVDSDLPWQWFQYKDYAYAVRRGSGGMFRIYDTVAQAGIDAPAIAPALADGGAGGLAAATYEGVFTYYNESTAIESNPSPAGSVALGASKAISWTGLTASSNSFVTHKRLYRSLGDQTGTYFFVGQVANAATSFTEDESVLEMGGPVSFKNGLPPEEMECFAVHADRLFASDGTDLFFSESTLVECFGGDVLPVDPDDGHKIRGLLGHGDRLIIGKTNKLKYLIGNSRATFEIHTLSDAHGCMAPHSMKSTEGIFFCYGSGKSVLRVDGASVRTINTPRVDPILQAIPDEAEEYIVGVVFPKLNWYMLLIPVEDEGGVGFNQIGKVLIYNYKYDTWTTFEHENAGPQFISGAYGQHYGQVLYSTHYDGLIYEYNREDYGRDDGIGESSIVAEPIVAEFDTRADDFGHPGYRKALDTIWVNSSIVPTAPEPDWRFIVLGEDGEEIAGTERSLKLDQEQDWKAIKVSSRGTPKTSLQLRGRYTGEAPMELRGLHFKAMVLPRRPNRPV